MVSPAQLGGSPNTVFGTYSVHAGACASGVAVLITVSASGFFALGYQTPTTSMHLRHAHLSHFYGLDRTQKLRSCSTSEGILCHWRIRRAIVGMLSLFSTDFGAGFVAREAVIRR